MKKILFILATLLIVRAQAQVEEGSIKYQMQFDGIGAGKNNDALINNASTSITFKKGKSLTETSTPMFRMRTVFNGNEMLMLVDAMNNKTYFRKTKAEIERETNQSTMQPSIIPTKEKKKILGYDCNKVIIQTPTGGGKQTQIVVWITDKIRTNAELAGVNLSMMKKMNGTPLEIDLEQGPVKTRAVAVNISLKPVPDAVFNISTNGYTLKQPSLPMAR